MHSDEKTYLLPPVVDLSVRPEDLYDRTEMDILRDWLKGTLLCRGVDDFNKFAKTWDDAKRAHITGMLAELRARGYYPDRIDANGSIVWGFMLKSHVQVEIDRNVDRYYRRGIEIKERHGYDEFEIIPILKRVEGVGEYA